MRNGCLFLFLSPPDVAAECGCLKLSHGGKRVEEGGPTRFEYCRLDGMHPLVPGGDRERGRSPVSPLGKEHILQQNMNHNQFFMSPPLRMARSYVRAPTETEAIKKEVVINKKNLFLSRSPPASITLRVCMYGSGEMPGGP